MKLMRFLIIIFILLFNIQSSYSYNNYYEALEAAKKDDNRGALFIFTGSWCNPCQRLKREIKPIISRLNKYTIVYFVDIDKERKIADYYRKKGKLEGVPTYILTDRKERSILRIGSGYKSQRDFIKWYSGK